MRGVAVVLALAAGALAQSRPASAEQPTPPGAAAGARFGGRRGDGAPARAEALPALQRGLAWLAAHQDADGRFDGAGFMKHDPAADRCTGAGTATHDIALTALAVLAFLGNGSTVAGGPHADHVARAGAWLVTQQRKDGRIDSGAPQDFLVDHALATWALAEAHGLSGGVTELGDAAAAALGYLRSHRDPRGVWRSQTGSGATDSALLVWCLFPNVAARDYRLGTDDDALAQASAWLDDVTDPETGRVALRRAAPAPASRAPALAGMFASETAETLTAAGLLCRFFLGQDPKATPSMIASANLVLAKLPRPATEGGTSDMLGWYFGSMALYQMGGRHWAEWSKPLREALRSMQRTDGAHAGSWDPERDAWGRQAGRIWTTALAVMTLESVYRYTRIVR